MTNPMSDIAVGGLVVVVALVIGIATLPILDGAIDDYEAGPDGDVAVTTDNPPASNVNLLQLTPFAIIGGFVLGGVLFIVRGAKQLA
jgi:hypothetical protein